MAVVDTMPCSLLLYYVSVIHTEYHLLNKLVSKFGVLCTESSCHSKSIFVKRFCDSLIWRSIILQYIQLLVPEISSNVFCLQDKSINSSQKREKHLKNIGMSVLV